MSNRTGCKYCEHSDTNRKNSNGEIRCTRYSMWVLEYDNICDEFYHKDLLVTLEDFNRLMKAMGRKSDYGIW